MPSTDPSQRSAGATAPARRDLAIEDCVNARCPWSGAPVSPDFLTLYKGRVVGFCKTDCRDKFERAVAAFEAAIAQG